MKKRLIAVLLCAAFLAALSWGSPYGADRGETYDLYFREADLSAAPGGDALRAEELHLEAEETQSALSVAERPRWTCPPVTGISPACRWLWRITPSP